MQGIVFTYRNKRQKGRIRFDQKKRSAISLFKNYGSVLLFAAALVIGLTAGCICSGTLSKGTLGRLDFLFMTNMPNRLSGGALGAFCAGFASDFLFLLAAFLLGLSLWGAAALPFVAFFRGFGVGVSAGYLMMTYGLKGVFFYVFVLLPGIVISCAALTYELGAAFDIFGTVLRILTGKLRSDFKKPMGNYLKKGLKYLVITFAASVVDAVLWFALAGLFF